MGIMSSYELTECLIGEAVRPDNFKHSLAYLEKEAMGKLLENARKGDADAIRLLDEWGVLLIKRRLETSPVWK